MFFVGVSGSFLPYILAIAFSWVVFGKAMFVGNLTKSEHASSITVTFDKQVPVKNAPNAFHFSHSTYALSLAEKVLCLRCILFESRVPEPDLCLSSTFIISPEKRGPPVC